MTQPFLLAFLFIGLGVLGWILPYRFNIFRLKRLAARLVAERHHTLVPKVVGSLVMVIGLVFAVLGLTIFRADPRGLPVQFVNTYGKTLEWVALEYPRDVEVTRGGPVAPGETFTLYYKIPTYGRLVAAIKRPDFNTSQGGNIPVDIGPRSVGRIKVIVNPDATMTVENGVL